MPSPSPEPEPLWGFQFESQSAVEEVPLFDYTLWPSYLSEQHQPENVDAPHGQIVPLPQWPTFEYVAPELPGVSVCVDPGHSDEAWCGAMSVLYRPGAIKHLIPSVAAWHPIFVQAVASYVHAKVAYREDPDSCELCSSADRTLARGEGDCDCKAFCAFTFVAAKGLNVWFCLGVVVQQGEEAGHAWCEGFDEFGWFLLEATNGTILRGERPAEYVLRSYLRAGDCRLAA